MKIEPNKVGGNSILVWWGKLLKTIGEYLVSKGDESIYNGNPRIISLPSCSWVNPFTIIYSFVIDNKDKYQLILENSAYKTRYIENNQEITLTEDELFQIIRENRKNWFLKN